jgi:hypothetical protein
VKFEIERDGKTLEVKVKLGEYTQRAIKRELETRFPRLFPAPAAPEVSPAPEATPKPPKAPRVQKRLIERFENWPGWAKRKYIGTYMESLNKELLDFFGVREESGLLVNRLTQNGPAEKAGVKVGDVVVRVDGQKVTSVGGLSELIQDKNKGDKVKLEIIRDKKPMALEVEVGEEEGPSVSWFYLTEPSRDAWRNMTKGLQQQYDRSREVYEKFSVTQRDKLKKLNEELLEKSRESYGKMKGLLEEQKAKELLLKKMTWRRKGIIYRA